MQPVSVFRPFCCEDYGLAETPNAVLRAVTPEVDHECPERSIETSIFERPAKPAKNTSDFVAKVFRKVADRGFDLSMHLMLVGISGPSERHDFQGKTGLFKPEQLLRYEGFRKARVTL